MSSCCTDAYNDNLEDVRITAWLITGLRHEAIRLGKKNRRLKEHELLILNGSISRGFDDEVKEMLDTIAAKSDILADVEDSIFIQEALALLTPQQQKVIRALVLEGHTEMEVAEQLQRSQPVVHRLKERALKRLKKNCVLDKPTGK